MRTLHVLAVALGVALIAPGCQRDDSSLAAKLDQIDKRLTSIEANLTKIGAGGRGMPGGQQRPQRPMPKPEETYSVPIAGAPAKGNTHGAKVTVVKAFEFACPYCEKARPTMDQLLADYGNDIQVVYKHFIVHPQHATTPALAACAAAKQNKFPDMEKLIWDKGFSAGRDLSKENMVKLAKEAGLNMDQFGKDMDGPDCAALVRKDQAELSKVGVGGTPAFYINGRFLSGARPVEQFKAVVDEELKKANERISKGEATADNYYEKFVVEKGKKQLDAAPQ